jgi:Purple acid Phosphatase, N-terminal domain/Calcineurin-like phosphoesterase
MRRTCSLLLVVVLIVLAGTASAHVGNHPSVHDTVAGVMQRLQREVDPEALTALRVPELVELLTDEERDVLGSQHLTFTVDVPVVVSVLREVGPKEVVFWLEGRGFKKTKHSVAATKDTFEVWQKAFPAGDVGLGVTSLSGDGDHYFVGIAPKKKRDSVKVTNIYPGRSTLGVLQVGERPYVSWDDRTLTEVPEALAGHVLLRGDPDKRRSAKLTRIWRMTDYPATASPDQIVLTWSEDPAATQTVQWRTSTAVDDGTVRYRVKGATSDWTTAPAHTELLENLSTVNDPRVNRHTATLRGLSAGTTYEYAVGDGSTWNTPAEFTTAPGETTPFKFVYMGDAQNGLDTWGSLVHKAYADEPDAAFYIMAGDLVNRGNERDDWDSFFYNATGVYDRRQLVPAIGNHENQGDQGPWMYLALFDLPDNGPAAIEPERAYTFEYSNALFVVLDSNLEPASQTEWLEEQLANTDATWKFVVYHHPAYSSGASRDNPEVRQLWGALFDKYHVDLALQGHDHAYLRTWPMHAEKRVASAKEGTIYIVSVSGTKFYDQGEFDYTEFGMTNVSTYQVLDIRIDGNKLTYKAYDINGDLRDEFVIEK